MSIRYSAIKPQDTNCRIIITIHATVMPSFDGADIKRLFKGMCSLLCIAAHLSGAGDLPGHCSRFVATST